MAKAHSEPVMAITQGLKCASLEDFIDKKIKEVEEKLNLNKELAILEEGIKETNELFEAAKKKLLTQEETSSDEKSKLNESSAINIASDSDDEDDDVQILKTTYDPSKVSSTPSNAPGGRYVRARFQDGSTRLFFVPPGVNPTEYLHSAALTQNLQNSQSSSGSLSVTSTPGRSSLPHQAGLGRSNLQDRVVRAAPRNLSNTLTPQTKIFARKKNEIWYKATLTDIQEKNGKRFKVKFDGKGQKVVTAKLLAMTSNPKEILPVGTRVVARYCDEKGGKMHFAGVVAEPPSERNRLRYLIFFDDGYAQYCTNHDIHLTYEQSDPVWDDVTNQDSKDFIQSYLQQYPERPMVRLTVGQTLQVEWDGGWWYAKVMEVDSSLVKMKFEDDGRTEWVYRGSARLEPLYTALHNQASGTKVASRRVARRLHPNKKQQVEYLRGGESVINEYDGKDQETLGVPKKATARKSTAKPGGKDMASILQERMNDSGGLEEMGFVQDAETNEMLKQMPRKPYVPHNCTPLCIEESEQDKSKLDGVNPLLIPLLLGWERQLASKPTAPRKLVMYRTPCGRRLRSLTETDQFLYLTKSLLTIDLFSFDAQLRTNVEHVSARKFCDIKDISYGKETVPISCVNEVDDTYPDYVDYSSSIMVAKDVRLNRDEEFLVGCDCQDGCREPSKCACVQMTIEAAKAGSTELEGDLIGYNGRRLREQIITGIYECNSRCKCNYTCHNRVVQNGLSLRLQVFKTIDRGWGVRCLDDIPKGTFVSSFTGKVMDESEANKEGQEFGDEYLAELDYIEVVERNKDGYESDVVMSDENSSSCTQSSDDPKKSGSSDSDCSVGKYYEKKSQRSGKNNSNKKNDKKKKGKSKTKRSLAEASDMLIVISDEEDAGHSKGSKKSKSDKGKQPKRSERLQCKTDTDGTNRKVTKKFVSARTYFGEEYCYVMDAKTVGNVGRFLNHSCSPNVFVQNVFVDTHDLRFPWVAFFAAQFIPSGSELTWDYNYEVGSVPGKVLYCYCGAQDCRGRLL